MKTLISALVLGLSFSAFAKVQLCTVDFHKEGSALNWTAFKTPKKVGVKAQFTEFSIKTTKSTTVDELLKSATFEVNSGSVSTNDKGRDAKIVKFFFKTMKNGEKITGKVVKVDAIKVDVEFTFNGTTKVVSLGKQYDEAKNTVTLSGVLDVIEFGMKDNLGALTNACKVLHEGVTWPDVNVELIASVTKSCK